MSNANETPAAGGIHKAVLRRMGKRAPYLARLITLVFSLFILAAGVWAGVTQVPGLVRAQGELTAQGNLRRVEHLAGGTVAEILAREGAFVKQGQIIARLSAEQLDIQIQQLMARADAVAATIARSKALLSDLPQDPVSGSHRANQGQSLRLQQAQMKLRLERRRAASELIRERAKSIETIRGVRDTAESRASAAKTRYDGYRELAERGTISRFDLNQRRDERDALITEYLRAEAELAAAKSRLIDAQNAYNELILAEREETLTTLNEAIEQQNEIKHQLLELQLKKLNLDIRAPIDGEIHYLSVGVPGEVIEPGGHVADVLPHGIALVAELRLMAKDIGQIAVDDDVALNVTTYARNRYGQVLGRVVSISPTSFSERDEDPYFKVIVALDRQFIGLEGNDKPLRAGMTVQAEIVTTARSVAQYLLKPLETTLSATMTEK